MIIVAIILSGLIINRALKDRSIRKEDEAMKRLLYQKQTPEKVEDWMDKFNQTKDTNKEVIQSREISAERFANAFKAHAGETKPVSAPIDSKLRDAASTVLDIHDKNQIIQSADQLLSSIESEGIAKPNINNESLESKPNETSLTTRRDPNELISSNISNKVVQNSVPLPERNINQDDLDF